MPTPQIPGGFTFNPGDVAHGIGSGLQHFWDWATKAPQVAQATPYQFDWTNVNQTLGRENTLADKYLQMAAGNGPSLAQGQLQQATDQNINQAMALGAAQQGQGLGYASALRNIADQSAAARQQAAGQSALIRNQEQMQGMAGAGSLLGQIAGQGFTQQGMGQGNALGYAGLNAQIAEGNANRQSPIQGVLSGIGQALPIVGNFLKPGQQTQGQMSAPDISEPIPMAHGGAVDSPAKDTVPIMATPGEEMVPLSIMSHPNAPELAAHFTAATKAGESPEEAKRSAFHAADFTAEMRGHGDEPHPGKHLAKMAALEKRVTALEGKKRKAA